MDSIEKITNNEQLLLCSIEGVVNKNNSSVFIVDGSNTLDWLDVINDSHLAPG